MFSDGYFFQILSKLFVIRLYNSNKNNHEQIKSNIHIPLKHHGKFQKDKLKYLMRDKKFGIIAENINNWSDFTNEIYNAHHWHSDMKKLEYLKQ